MVITQLTDGMVMDHVAEFIYYPAERLKTLYDADRVGYVDALCKFIQITATTDHLAMSPDPPNQEMGDLKEALGDLVDVTAFSSSLGTDQDRRHVGLAWLKDNWKEIEQVLLNDPFSAQNLNGHVQREFYRCFLLPENKRQSMDRYVNKEEILPLNNATMNLLLTTLNSTLQSVGEHFEPLFVETWIQQTVTTHYRNFAEYGLFYRHQYAPAGTRSQIPILKKLPEQDTLACVTRCIAADVLYELVRKGGRRALVDVVRSWHSQTKAEKIRSGYSDLIDKFCFLPVEGRRELMGDINGILDSERGLAIDLAMGSVAAIMQTVKLQNASTSLAMRTPKALRWLYSIRRPRVTHEIFGLVDDLVKAA